MGCLNRYIPYYHEDNSKKIENLSQLAKYAENGYGMAIFMIFGAFIWVATFPILNYQSINKINKTKQI